VLSFRDISQRSALDRLKDEFISTVSHELRTRSPPSEERWAAFSGILGKVSDKAANLLRIALTNSDRLVRLINDILDLERIQSGKEPLAYRPVQLAEIVRQAIDGMQPVAEAGGVQLIHDTIKVEIEADPDRLLQVLTNLLSNAVKFSPPNSAISVVLRPGVSGVTLSVIDQGRGIPADKLDAIFGRFQQVEASDSRQMANRPGTCHLPHHCPAALRAHLGGTEPLARSTFRVFLPYKPVPKTLLDSPAASSIRSQAREQSCWPTPTRPPPLIAAQLTRHGYRVIQTATVEQTLAAAQERVEAILLDTSLDGMSGWEILPMLRHLDPNRAPPSSCSALKTGKNPLICQPR